MIPVRYLLIKHEEVFPCLKMIAQTRKNTVNYICVN